MRIFVMVVLATSMVGCGDAGGANVAFPLYLAGSDVSEPFAAGDATVIVERADLAFGPLYLCAGTRAGELCGTARVEWLGSSVVSAADPVPAYAGELEGVTGAVRSFMYDLGFTSLLTRPEPLAMPAAEALGASLVLEGTALVDDVRLPFSTRVRVAQEAEANRGVPVVLGTSGDVFGHPVTADEDALLVTFDPRSWLRGVDFREIVARECSATCPPSVAIEEASRAHRALHNALVAGEAPRFIWGFEP